jgi:hypothetical protein
MGPASLLVATGMQRCVKRWDPFEGATLTRIDLGGHPLAASSGTEVLSGAVLLVASRSRASHSALASALMIAISSSVGRGTKGYIRRCLFIVFGKDFDPEFVAIDCKMNPGQPFGIQRVK